MQIIYDHQLDNKTIMPLAVKALEQFFIAASNGNTLSPPRHSIETTHGGLTFTIGAETEFSQSIGFRVYDTYPGRNGTDSNQIIAVYSTQNSRLKGLFIGSKLGAIRTAAINAVALKYMSNPKATTATIIGAGHQAAYQIKALLTVRQLKTIYIHNRTPKNAKTLITKLQSLYDVDFKISQNLQKSLSKSQIVICATSSPSPLLQTDWLTPNCYVGSIGAKYGNQHELPLDITNKCALIATDSSAQFTQYNPPYQINNLTPLSDIIQNNPQCDQGIKFFLSTGLSGTEVVIGDAILKHFH